MPEQDIFKLEERNKEILAEQRREHRREIEDIKKLLKLPEGRRFFWRIWGLAGLFREPFNPNSNQTGYNLGRMSIGRDLLANVNEADAAAFAKIQQEYLSVLYSKKETKEAKEE